jgi:hypothetical protein
MVFSVADVLPKMTTKTKRQILTKKKKILQDRKIRKEILTSSLKMNLLLLNVKAPLVDQKSDKSLNLQI